MTIHHKNNLSKETSPYLLQHADNPVDWYPWNAQALANAREQDKPILLSVGYSACHWCHVMAHESFEDPETAMLMNRLFINIKVDREERPDIDKIYQTAQHILSQKTGGWPLTMFLTPQDHIPFFGGTYFPSESRFGLPSFKELLQRVSDLYQQQRDDINKQKNALLLSLQGMDEMLASNQKSQPNIQVLHDTTQQLQKIFDKQFGGFGEAPKFPHTTSMEHLLRQYLKNADRRSLDMVNTTLQRMALGGIYDQLVGGFYRYSVDRQWMIPHFEKMLYDNGLLLALYSQVWQVTKQPLYKKIVQETADWVINEMQSPLGGYFSSLDADSENEEGRFYAWTREQVRSQLSDAEYAIFAPYYGLDQNPNFEGKWHLRVMQDTTSHELLQQARQKMLAYRVSRIAPECDDKILTSWNALMIKGMAIAAWVFDNDHYRQSAEQAMVFIEKQLWVDGKLLATYRADKAHLNAYLDDYAFLIDAILCLLQCRWHTPWMNMAIQLADQLVQSFEDHEKGGFFFTSHDHEKLMQRSKSFMDDSLPAGNGVAVRVLARMGYLLGESRYLESSARALRSATVSLEKYPSAHPAMLHALDEYLTLPKQIVVMQPTEAWLKVCRQCANPFHHLLAIPESASDLPGMLAQYERDTKPVAYICEGQHCLPPIYDLDKFRELLGNS